MSLYHRAIHLGRLRLSVPVHADGLVARPPLACVQKWVLLATSYLFYSSVDVRWGVLLLVHSLFSWGLGELICRTQVPERKRGWLVAGVGANVFALGIFKYYDFFRAR